MTIDDPARDCESEATARIASLESIEQLRKALLVDPWAAVDHVDRGPYGAPRNAQPDIGATRADTDGVIDEVGHSFAQQVLVGADLCRRPEVPAWAAYARTTSAVSSARSTSSRRSGTSSSACARERRRPSIRFMRSASATLSSIACPALPPRAVRRRIERLVMIVASGVATWCDTSVRKRRCADRTPASCSLAFDWARIARFMR